MAKEFTLQKRCSVELKKDGIEYIFIMASGFYHKSQLGPEALKAEYHTFGKLFKKSELSELIREMEKDENKLKDWSLPFSDIFDDTVFNYMKGTSNSIGAIWLRNAIKKAYSELNDLKLAVEMGQKRSVKGLILSGGSYFGWDKLKDEKGNDFKINEENIFGMKYCKN